MDTFQETSERHTPNEYENVVTAHIEAAAKCIPTKPRGKCRVPWEAIAIREKRDDMKESFLFNKEIQRRPKSKT